jgi:hypothetical protein
MMPRDRVTKTYEFALSRRSPSAQRNETDRRAF